MLGFAFRGVIVTGWLVGLSVIVGVALVRPLRPQPALPSTAVRSSPSALNLGRRPVDRRCSGYCWPELPTLDANPLPSVALPPACRAASDATAAPVRGAGNDPAGIDRGRCGELRPTVASAWSRTGLAAGIAAVLTCGALSLPAPAHATATSYERGVSSVDTGSTTASSLNVAAPATLMVGDLMVLEIDATGATAIATPPGWTNLGGTTSSIGY